MHVTQTGKTPARRYRSTSEHRMISKHHDPQTLLVGPVGAVMGIAAGSAFLGATWGVVPAVIGGVAGLGLGIYREVVKV